MSKKIKIFVSHRIDQDSTCVESPVYAHVKCGSIFSDEISKPFLRDDSGDNISHKRMYYNELTVQYYAWKNFDLDYYGLCHYRRYLSFSDDEQKLDNSLYGFLNENRLDDDCIKKYNLSDYYTITTEIEKYDAILAKPQKVSLQNTPAGFHNRLRDHLEAFSYVMFPPGIWDLVLDTVKEHAPEYYNDLLDYLNGEYLFGYNCFVLNKALFDELCAYEFHILDILEGKISLSNFSESMSRVCGYVGEVLCGAFVASLLKRKDCRVKLNRIVFFQNTFAKNQVVKREKKVDAIPIVTVCGNNNFHILSVMLQSLILNAKKRK